MSNIHLGTILRNSDPMSLLNDEILAIISRRVPVNKISYCFKDKTWFSSKCSAARDSKQAAYHNVNALESPGQNIPR